MNKTTNKEAILTAAIETVCEGWTLPADARKILEKALWTPTVAATPSVYNKSITSLAQLRSKIEEAFKAGDATTIEHVQWAASLIKQGESIDSLPPLPEHPPCSDVQHGLLYTERQMRQAQRDAIAADRIARTAAPSNIVELRSILQDFLIPEEECNSVDFDAIYGRCDTPALLAEIRKRLEAAAPSEGLAIPAQEYQVFFNGDWKPASEQAYYSTSDRHRRIVPAIKQIEPKEVLLNDICYHDDTIRQGTIWEVCKQCGKRWADDVNPRTTKESNKNLEEPETVYDQLANDLLSTGISVMRIAPEDFLVSNSPIEPRAVVIGGKAYQPKEK